MIDNGYLYISNNNRIFVNLSLGCSGECSYCYLPKIGYSNKETNFKTISAKELLDYLKKNNIRFDKNTLITIGCYSECFASYNKIETIKIIKYFLNNGNQIQLSTKKKISEKDILEILPWIKYYGQLVIFVSSATISKQSSIEKNTDSIYVRLKNFQLLNDLKIPAVLYMKPVLKNITIIDLEEYKKYIMEYNIKDVVVGSIFTNNISSETVAFSDKNQLFYNPDYEEVKIINSLSKLTSVYRRSTEVMKKYKKLY